MAHFIEVIRSSEAEARSFLDALHYSDSVSAIGFRPHNEIFVAVAVNWDADEEVELDEQVSSLVTDSLEADDNLDEILAYRQIFPDTILYNSKQ